MIWLKVTKSDDGMVLRASDTVTVTRMNHLTEVQYMARVNTKNHIRKLDKDRYVVLEDGEIKDFTHTENRKQGFNSLRQTFKKLRYLINNNFVGGSNEWHVTLTYKENMTDTVRLYDDFKNFMKRFKYRYKAVSTLDYISVVEPQGRGAWHCHVLIRFNDADTILLTDDDIRDLWSYGTQVSAKTLNEVDNIGAYLSAYLSDVELSDDSMLTYLNNRYTCEVPVKITSEGKKYIKGGRLHMYPPGMNLYRRSKGIRSPDREKMKYGQIKSVVGSAHPHYTATYYIEDLDHDFSNVICYEQYNTKRSNTVNE